MKGKLNMLKIERLKGCRIFGTPLILVRSFDGVVFCNTIVIFATQIWEASFVLGRPFIRFLLFHILVLEK